MSDCPLCPSEIAPTQCLWEDEQLRVLLCPEPGYPAFCRVIWRQHIAEMTDLNVDERMHLMTVVWLLEAALRALLAPDKINLASLGNQVPHLHWHVIPRFNDDRHFPDTVWAQPRRHGVEHPLNIDSLRKLLESGMA